MKDIRLNIESYSRENYTWGVTKACAESAKHPNGRQPVLYTEVLVEGDDTIRVFDPISKTYSVSGTLTDHQRGLITDRVRKIRAGTHYVAGGFVFEKSAAPTA